MSKFNLSSAVQAELTDIANKGAAVYATAERGWSPLVRRFRAIAAELNITDRKSDGGKAIDAFMRPLVVAALVKSGHYDVAVHRVGSGDDYLPVDEAHPANYTITGAFAVSADLTELSSQKDAPRGMKAWLRGNVGNGLRPDGEKGSRDVIKNAVDQVLSRFWKRDKSSGGTGPEALDSKLLGLYKVLKGSRDRWETDGGEVLSDAEFKVECDRFADKVLKRTSRKAKQS
jgi:hypothetical protein